MSALLDRETSPPPGGVSYLVGSLIKNPKEEDPPQRSCTKCFEVGHLPPGSWLGNIVNRNPPGGGVSCDHIVIWYSKLRSDKKGHSDGALVRDNDVRKPLVNAQIPQMSAL